MQVRTELIEACQRGESSAFDDLVRETYRPVFSLVYRIVGDPDDAADVTQDVYVRVWRSIRGFRGDSSAGTWLHRIAVNTALTFLKRRAKAGIATDPAVLPEEAAGDGADERADAELLGRALRTLPDQHRAVVVLKDVYGWSCEEIAKEMGTTPGAVKVRLFRARQRLADVLAGEGVVIPLEKQRKKRTS